jgi:chromate reductase, NAD(P)H dehydrogenase (quinone)
MKRVLAISGSLRKASINSALLRAASRLAPPDLFIQIYDRTQDIPPFNFDLDKIPPEPVEHLRRAVASSDAMIIASPEYAHGVSGVMKNMLDWLVSLEAFFAKPVAILNAQPRATYSDSALRETLSVMSASIIESASVPIFLRSETLTEEGMLASSAVTNEIAQALQALLNALRVQTHTASPPPANDA